MNPTKSKLEWEAEFKAIYINILRKTQSYEALSQENENSLNRFKEEYTLDSNSIDFLPAYFNFIECSLAQNSDIGSVKKYLIVGLTNLLNATKKKEGQSGGYSSGYDYDREEVNKKLLKSRLDLLFARYNILTRNPEAIDKLSTSIISYSEIYGPENVGLTPQYYYLAEYFLDFSSLNEKGEKKQKAIVKNIYAKVADMWKNYFVGNINPLFLINDDEALILAIGEAYVKLISTRIGNIFRDTEFELELKYKMIKVVILKRTDDDIYEKALENVLDLYKSREDLILDKDYMTEIIEQMQN